MYAKHENCERRKKFMQSKVKKLWATTLAAAVAVSTIGAALAFHVNATAAKTVNVTIDDATAVNGKFVTDVKLTGIPSEGIMAMDFAIGFDSSKITIDTVTEGKISKDTGATEAELALVPDLADTQIAGGEYSCFDYVIADNQIRVLWATGLGSDYWVKTDGVLLTIAGSVKTGASGTTELKLEPTKRETYAGSGVQNNAIIFGYLTGEVPTKYEVNATKGVLSLGTAATTPVPTGTTPKPSDTTATTPKPSGTTVKVEPTVVGDVDDNGKVDIGDVILLSKYLVGTADLNAQQKANADTTKDGEVDVTDNFKIVQFIANIISQF
jgi:hypothetical protein